MVSSSSASPGSYRIVEDPRHSSGPSSILFLPSFSDFEPSFTEPLGQIIFLFLKRITIHPFFYAPPLRQKIEMKCLFVFYGEKIGEARASASNRIRRTGRHFEESRCLRLALGGSLSSFYRVLPSFLEFSLDFSSNIRRFAIGTVFDGLCVR